MLYLEAILLIIILVLIAMLHRERFQASKREERYINRIMAKDLEEYRLATIELEKSHAERIAEMEKENELVINANNQSEIQGMRLT